MTPGGPAAGAGIRAGDVIAKVAGHAVASVDDIAVAIAEERPGSQVAIDLQRAGGSRTVKVTLGELPASG